MKKLLLTIALLFAVSANAQAQVNPALSGSWYNPEQSGHGFEIEVA